MSAGDLSSETKRFLMDKLSGRIAPDVLIDHPQDDSAFIWIDVVQSCLWVVSVREAKFVVGGSE